MSKALVRIAGMALAALLVLPTVARAGVIDWIYEMSGAQLVGTVFFRCEIDLETQRVPSCPNPWALVQPRSPRLWLDLDAALYLSTGKDSALGKFEKFDTVMIAFDPMVGARSRDLRGGAFLHHGLGLTFNALYGDRFDHFTKKGLKIQPVAVAFRTGRFTWDAALTFRVYPDKFTAADFGFDPSGVSRLDKRKELVKGLTVGLVF